MFDDITASKPSQSKPVHEPPKQKPVAKQPSPGRDKLNKLFSGEEKKERNKKWVK